MKGLSFVAAVAAAVLLCGCSSVALVSQLNPNYPAHAFHKIMVVANFHSLVGRANAERNLCREIKNSTTADCIGSSQLFFTGERHPKKEIQAKIKQLGIDGVLTIAPAGAAILKATQEKDVFGNPVSDNRVQQAYGNYMTAPDARPAYKIVLRDPASQEIVWYGSTMATQDADDANFDEYTADTAEEVVNRMIQDGILIGSDA